MFTFRILLFLLLSAGYVHAQDVSYGIKVGAGINSQLFTNGKGGITLTPNVDLYIARQDEGIPVKLYAQLGYHQRGSARRQAGFSVSGPAYTFHNVVFESGISREYEANHILRYYYLFGVRGEYTLGDNLDQTVRSTSLGSLNFLAPTFTQRFLYGVSIGGGLIGTFGGRDICLEVSVNPDLSSQYDQPYALSYTHPEFGRITLPARKGRNISIEVKVGYFF